MNKLRMKTNGLTLKKISSGTEMICGVFVSGFNKENKYSEIYFIEE